MATTRYSERSYNWVWVAALCACLGILDATHNVFAMRHEGMHHSWVKMFFALSLAWFPWVLATTIVVDLARRYPLVWKPAAAWLVHLGTLVAIDIVVAAWAAGLEVLLQPWMPDFATRPFLVTWSLKISGGLVPTIILYAVVLAVTYVLDSRARAAAQQTDTARLNEQLSYVRLNALQRQMEPHFIFNTLNSISGLVREQKNEAAVNMVVALSEFLRKVAMSSNEPLARLAEEVAFAEKYLRIQAMRFGDRLKVQIEIPDELSEAKVPSLILQPLVENAIKHGIATRAQGGEVRLEATRSDSSSGGMLVLSVYNDGPLLDTCPRAVKDGIGLSNLRTRCKLLYGENFRLRLEDYGITGVQVSVALPYRDT